MSGPGRWIFRVAPGHRGRFTGWLVGPGGHCAATFDLGRISYPRFDPLWHRDVRERLADMKLDRSQVTVIREGPSP